MRELNTLVKKDYIARAEVLKAMAHPSRLLMIDALAQGERCVCELTEMVGHDMSTVSKHLALLKRTGIVRRERRGQQIYYQLAMPCVLGFFGCIENVLNHEECSICAN